MEARTTGKTMGADEMGALLKQYAYGLKLLKLNRYEKDYFDGQLPQDELFCADDEAYIKAQMFEVKRFVTSLPPDDRKLFLYYHYIRCETVERCGELLGISRRSAFRLKRRALEYAAIKYRQFMPPIPRE